MSGVLVSIAVALGLHEIWQQGKKSKNDPF